MTAKLYDGARLVGQLEIEGRKPFSIRVTYSLSGELVELGAGLDRALIAPTAVVEVYHKRVSINARMKEETIDYQLARREAARI